jgi:hypothetical protein
LKKVETGSLKQQTINYKSLKDFCSLPFGVARAKMVEGTSPVTTASIHQQLIENQLFLTVITANEMPLPAAFSIFPRIHFDFLPL